MSAPKEVWLVQVTTKEDLVECPMPIFRRLLKGTGIEVDQTYKPARVSPKRFVGRGFATKKVARKLQNFRVESSVYLFKEVAIDLPDLPALPAPDTRA